MFVINWLRVFSRTLPTAGLVGMPGHFYQHHLSPTLSPIQSNGGEGAMAFWTVVVFRWRIGILIGFGLANPSGIGSPAARPSPKTRTETVR